ncbi:hypothetical protein [Streptomyces asiaticus]
MAGDGMLPVRLLDRGLVQINLYRQVRVLLPVLEDLLRDVVAHRFEFGLAIFEVLCRQSSGSRAGELQQSPSCLHRGRTGLFFLAIEVCQSDPAGKVLVAAEVEELRLAVAQNLRRAPPGTPAVSQTLARGPGEEVDVRCGVVGILCGFQSLCLLQGCAQAPGTESAAQRGRHFLVVVEVLQCRAFVDAQVDVVAFVVRDGP